MSPESTCESEVPEALVQARGRELLAGVEPERLLALTPAWWQERLMGWATADPEFRVKLLRFVDVLPTLRTASAVSDHVRQYFRGTAPLPLRAGAAVAGSAAFRPVLSKVVRQGVFAMADRFIGGGSPAEALPRLRALTASGTGYTVDLLGEATLSGDEADAYRDRYLELVRVLADAAGPDTAADPVRRPNVSLKLSALTAHFEPAAPAATCDDVLTRLLPVLRLARERGVFVNVDMEQYRFRELTHYIFAAVARDPAWRDWDGLGIVVQAYLRDAAGDIARLRSLAEERGTPVTVRLVKGAYWDEEVVVARQEGWAVPVFEEKPDTDANFERCAALLASAYPHLRPAFGTHNPRSIAVALAAWEQCGHPVQDAEFQMLYGMAEGLRKGVQRLGYRTRVYVPAGEIIPGMAYLVRRLLENTSNESWLVHRHEEGDPDELLAPPAVSAPAAPGGLLPPFANEAALPLHLPLARVSFGTAVEAARSRAPGHHPLLLAGGAVDTADCEEVRYPADPSQLVGTVARAEVEHVEEAVGAATKAYEAWRARGAEGRAAILRHAAGLLVTRRLEFAALEVLESGKPWREADGDVCEAVDYLRYYALQAERLAAGAPLLQPPGETNELVYEPRGVAAVISPWNFPLAIPAGMTTAALAAGCPVIVKPAEQSPLVAHRFVGLLREAGVPPAVVQCLPGPGETVGKALVEHPLVDVVAFTGSNAVGLEILRQAAVVRPGQRNVKRAVVEMGGKNAVIVDDDADLDQAVAGVVASAFGYAGQKCSACSRVVVLESAYDEFRARLAAAVRSLPVGPPHDPHTSVPPVISAEARERIERYRVIGETEGHLVAAGRVPDGPGHYVAPSVYEGISPDSRLACEEVFGPVLAMWSAPDFEAALALALDSPFGLTGGLFSRNPARIARARDAFRVGNLYINRKVTGAAVGRQPFGGLAMSGVGDKAGGPDYLLQFLAPRTITENTLRRGFAPPAGPRGT